MTRVLEGWCLATSEIVSKLHDMVMCDRQVTKRCTSSAVGISQERVHSILIEDLEMKKLSAHWVPRLLTVDQKHTRLNMSRANRNLFSSPDHKVLMVSYCDRSSPASVVGNQQLL